MRNVGDVYAKSPVSVLESFQRNRIVEVTCVDGVDCDDGICGEINSPIGNRFVERVGLLSSYFECVFGEITGQPKLVNDGLRINARSTARAEYIRDCLLYTSPSPRDQRGSRMPSSA